MKLISRWRSAWRLWSVRLNLMGLLLIGAEQALALWPVVPAEARAFLPPWISLPFFAASVIARIVRQEKLRARESTPRA